MGHDGVSCVLAFRLALVSQQCFHSHFGDLESDKQMHGQPGRQVAGSSGNADDNLGDVLLMDIMGSRHLLNVCDCFCPVWSSVLVLVILYRLFNSKVFRCRPEYGSFHHLLFDILLLGRSAS